MSAMNDPGHRKGGLRSPAPIVAGGLTICIVTGALGGLDEGIATTSRALALVLRELGYEVDLLYTEVEHGKASCHDGAFADHVEEFRKYGVNLKCIGNRGGPFEWPQKSYLMLQHLLCHRYSLVFFDDIGGIGYYPLLARRTGCANLQSTHMCVIAHGATEWTMELDPTRRNSFETFRLIEMERRSIELADSVKAPSAYILQKYRGYGWKLPEHWIVLPPFAEAPRTVDQSLGRIPVDEIVFFSNLKARNGLWMFCRTLDRLKFKIGGRTITFLGKASPDTTDALDRYSAAWPFTPRVLTNLDGAQALDYLQSPGRVAVIAAPEDNSPAEIRACLENAVPFIACSGSGGEELLDAESRKVNLFAPSVDSLCAKLLQIFEQGAATARPSFDRVQQKTEFKRWLGHRLHHVQVTVRPEPEPRRDRPIVIVISPTGFDADQLHTELDQVISDHDGEVGIEVLDARPQELQRKMKADRSPWPVKISAHQEFEQIARTLASGLPTLIGICHAGQMIPPAWFNRARACFELENSISALTGMTAAKRELDGAVLCQYLRTATGEHHIERYLLGNTPPLFALTRETNGGFLLMRSQTLAKCAAFGPLDARYGRLKDMRDWIHELVVTLHIARERFELVPDMIMAMPAGGTNFEVFRPTHFMRSLSGSLYGYEIGSNQHMQARLAIDLSLDRERSCVYADYIRNIEQRLGKDVLLLPSDAPWADQARQLAAIARAGGQIALAADLSDGRSTSED